ncbi:MAG: T9SS type A sorting domain-containing protein [bacterium]|nr:T9SS type A sorting domain-containing protein [bacterium]
MNHRIHLAFLLQLGCAVLFLLGLGEVRGQPEAWHVIYSSELDFFDVHFMDQQHGIATNTIPLVSVYKTNDGGFTWEPSIMWIDFYTNGDGIEFYNERIGYLIGGTRTASTSDGGSNWTIHYHGGNQYIEQVAYIDSQKMIAVGNVNHGPDSTIRRIYRSTDGGATWTTIIAEVGQRGFNYVVSVAESLQVVSVQRGDEIWRSRDQGLTWSLDVYSSNSITDMCSPSANVIIASGFTLPDSLHGWAVGYDGLVAQTADGGDTWESYFLDSVNVFLTSVSFIDSINGWTIDPTGQNGSSLQLFRYGEPQNSEEPHAHNFPQNLQVHPASPNPFNNTTNIQFSIQKPGNVSATIYDLTGREVIQLQNGGMAAGAHELRWNAGSLASGIYLCRIEWNYSIRHTAKLVYLR